MATIIETRHGFIGGDPDTILHAGNHWCEYCRGDGLEYDDANELTVCGMCSGVGQVECGDPDCTDHAL